MQLVDVASECYPEVEARQIAEMIILAKGRISRNDLLIEPNVELEIPEFETICDELRSWRPVQYIVGKADFADLELTVREGVLIPRRDRGACRLGGSRGKGGCSHLGCLHR